MNGIDWFFASLGAGMLFMLALGAWDHRQTLRRCLRSLTRQGR